MGTFTLVHVLLSFIAIGSGFLVISGFLKAKESRPPNQYLFGDRAPYDHHRVLLSVSRLHACDLSRHRIARPFGNGPLCAASAPPRWSLAENIRYNGCDCALSECLCPGCAALREGSAAQGHCADTNRGAIRHCANCRSRGLCQPRRTGGAQIPWCATSCRTSGCRVKVDQRQVRIISSLLTLTGSASESGPFRFHCRWSPKRRCPVPGAR
jgi:hypothetical protein